MKYFIISFIVVLTLGFTVAYNVRTVPQSWEYYRLFVGTVITRDDTRVQTQLDSLGRAQWELVAATSTFYIFKRPK